MTVKRFFLALFLFPMLFSCASMPSPEEVKAEVANYKLPKEPNPNKAIVYVVRPTYIGTLVSFDVYLDGKEEKHQVGSTTGNEHIYFDVEPGKHKIYSEAENFASIDIDPKPGDVIFLQQEVLPGFIMARNSLSELLDYEGKYFVKHTSSGRIFDNAPNVEEIG